MRIVLMRPLGPIGSVTPRAERTDEASLMRTGSALRRGTYRLVSLNHEEGIGSMFLGVSRVDVSLYAVVSCTFGGSGTKLRWARAWLDA